MPKKTVYSYLVVERFELYGNTQRYIQIASSMKNAIELALEMAKCHFGDTCDETFIKEVKDDLKACKAFKDFFLDYSIRIIQMEVNIGLAEIL